MGMMEKKAYLLTGIISMLLAVICLNAGCLEANQQPADEAESQDTDISERKTGGDWELWTNGTLLRGANIYQRRVYPELDGADFIGPGPVGPPYTQEDIDALAALGANYVQVSHPGLFGEKPPFGLDQDMQDNLDRLLDMIDEAGMYAVISFRTGPGRSEFTFFWDEVGTWFDACYLNDSVWEDPAAQDAWAAMWRYTARRYCRHPAVVGYELMVEPNSNDRLLDIWDPEEFYDEYAGTLYDWNQLFPCITSAVREVDEETPVLVGGNGYSAIDWLTYVVPSRDTRTVYTFHQYAPYVYTHQEAEEAGLTYPGVFDVDDDGVDDVLDRGGLNHMLSTVDDFAAAHGAPLALTEYGVVRWAPGAGLFISDQLDLLEERGINHAIWVWDPSWEPWNMEIDAFNFMHGPYPDNHRDVDTSRLIEVITRCWERNLQGS
ncbi:MAG: cellulase family glycosylhydrolase [Actinomycetota bacterium]|nr:cellulase family glycosylhydrolase [Actinomycetota bacterium]